MARDMEGHAPCKHLAPNILSTMAVNYCGRQLTRRLVWSATPAYHKKERATLHPGAWKFSLQYDRRPDGRFGVWVGTWNLGSLRGKGGEVCEELRKRVNDVCCLLEVRWRGQGDRMLGMKERRYNLWWSGRRWSWWCVSYGEGEAV